MRARAPGKGFQRGTLSVGEFILDYAEAGPEVPAETIVSLPGSAGLEMSIAKDRLSQTYRVVEINPPGWGGKTDLNRPMLSGELAQLLCEAVLQVGGRGSFLLGTSAGGSNALQVAGLAPGCVQGIILEASMAPSRPEDRRARMSGTNRVASEILEPDEFPLPIDPAAYPVPSPDPRKPWATEEFIQLQMKNRFAWFRWMRTDYYPTTAMSAINEAGIPILALLGTDDELLRPTQERTIGGALPHALFRHVPRGLHDLQNTVPEDFVSEVCAFIQRTIGICRASSVEHGVREHLVGQDQGSRSTSAEERPGSSCT